MKRNKSVLWAAGGFLAVAFAGILATPRVAAAIRATFVEVVIPSRPYNVTTTFDSTAFKVFGPDTGTLGDRKSTRLNSSHRCISYAVFCLKKRHQQGKGLMLQHTFHRGSVKRNDAVVIILRHLREAPLLAFLAILQQLFFFNDPPPPGISPLTQNRAFPL